MASHRENRSGSRHALVAGGGTGGHVFPALALAEALRERGWTVSLVGRSGEMEERLAVRHGVPFLALDAAPLVGSSWFGKLGALWTTMRSALAGRRLVRSSGADVVIGTGGYVSVPAVLGARMAGKPTLLFEPNAEAGVANRWLSRWAGEAAVAYGSAARSLACPTTETGTPVRAAFFEQAEVTDGEGLEILVLGGSQGALQLNEMVPAAIDCLGLSGRTVELRITHQAGAGHVETTRAAYQRLGLTTLGLTVTEFLDDVAGSLGRADLVISRAGAVTLAEICAVGRPAILIPLEMAGGHQRRNAEALAAAAAADVLPVDAGAKDLAQRLGRLLEGADLRRSMGRAARSLSRPNAASQLADLVISLGGVV